MLILILSDIQYLQKVIFSFGEGSTAPQVPQLNKKITLQ